MTPCALPPGSSRDRGRGLRLPPSGGGRRHSHSSGFESGEHDRGFTLIELVVVVAIVAVLAAAATLSVNAVGGARVAEREARRFEALVSLACERAETTGRDVGVLLGAHGYAFSTFLPTGWRTEPAGDLRVRDLPKGFSLTARRDGIALELVADLPDAPQLVCYASGELTPFALEIDAGPSLPRYAVRGAADGVLEWRQQDDRP